MSRSVRWSFLIAVASSLGVGEFASGFDISFDVPPPSGQFPLATYSSALSNNGNEAVGHSANASGSVVTGFERLANGTLTSPIIAPGDNDNYTRALGVNNSGTVIGDFLNTTGGTNTYHGFILSNGVFSQFDVGGPVSTSISGINDEGNIVGTFGSYVQPNEGFVVIGGTLSEFTIAGATSLFAYAINDNNQVVGQYTDASGITHAYIRSATGAITTFDAVAGATFTAAYGINDAGMIVGDYTDAAGISHGYIRSASGLVSNFSVFGSGATEPLGINDLGEVTGAYVGTDGVTHGFITSPLSVPEPSSIVMVGLGAVSFLGATWHRKCVRKVTCS
jgi:hypothetical protein